MLGMAMLLKNPIGLLAYVFIILAFLSLWCNRKIWIWAPLFIISYVCAFYGGVANLRALVSIGVLLLCILSLTQEIPGFIRMFIVLFVACLTLAMFAHIVPGFHNMEFANQWTASPDSMPMNLYMNYDKAISALFILAFLMPLIQTSKGWWMMLFAAVPWACLTIGIMGILGYLMQIVVFDPKLPAITFLWLVRQIFFVVIPEEALFRGFIQREITKGLNNSAAGALAVLITALLFGFLHLLMIPTLSFFLVTFAAGLLYGAIYQMTQRIEASIFVHLTFNIAHFFFFTYPILSSATL